MKKRKSPLILILGISLVVISLSFAAILLTRVHTGYSKSQIIIGKMEELLPGQRAGTPEIYTNPNMPVLEIDGIDYVAMVEVPSFDVTLPVSYDWNGNNLFASPARFYGSAYDHSLVIGGGDYSHQFAFCDKIENGAVVTLTDMTGAKFTYTVAKVERAKDADSTWLSSSDYDLTLFCRSIYSMDYIAVRCDFAYN